MAAEPFVSIIIPLYVITPRFFKDLKKFNKLNYKKYEILVVCDKKVKINNPKTKLILTGQKRTGPAEKRDIAIQKAKGEICAFIDDDAYPDKDWLKNAVTHFRHPNIAAVGGPGLTPKEDKPNEQLTGLVYSSFFCGGFAQHRFVKKKMQFVEDYPAYNLLVKTDVLREIGGYGSHFYGGEDTFLCLKIIKARYKIIYDPKVVVHHHRRALFLPYLSQIANIGKHRGYFAKKYPETSRRPMYFMPSLFTIGVYSLLVLSLFFKEALITLVGLYLLIFLVVTTPFLFKINPKKTFYIGHAIISTHLIYGTNFMLGLFPKNIKR